MQRQRKKFDDLEEIRGSERAAEAIGRVVAVIIEDRDAFLAADVQLPAVPEQDAAQRQLNPAEPFEREQGDGSDDEPELEDDDEIPGPTVRQQERHETDLEDQRAICRQLREEEIDHRREGINAQYNVVEMGIG